MPKDYAANDITVTTDWTELNTDFDIGSLNLYPLDGDILFQFRTKEGWGDSITGKSGVPMEEEIECLDVRIKAVSGTVNVLYFVKKAYN